MCKLFKEGQQERNAPLLRELFNHEEVDKISSLLLCSRRQPNKLIWNGTHIGDFSVISAYHLGKEIMERDRGSGSRGHPVEELWGTLWRIQGPQVVKTFLWKVCHNILPNKANLHHRKITTNPLCPLCGKEEETPGHILWSCLFARDV